MGKMIKNSLLCLSVATIASLLFFSVTYAESQIVSQPEDTKQTKAQIESYWTSERMAKAIPMPLPEVEAIAKEASGETKMEPLGPPGFVSGTLPNSNGEPDQNWVSEEPQYGGPPGNWSTSYPGPFQRWMWFGRYLTYPTSTIGKMFFTQNGTNYVCSGAVIYAGSGDQDVIATAGHCVNDGSGNWSSNVMFCPSYNPNGVNPKRGCWASDTLVTFTAWAYNSAIEADVACIVASNTGTIHNNHIGNITGTLGRAWNYGADEPTFSFGYPAAYPFSGDLIAAVAGPEWYTYDWGGTDYDGSSLADSKYMGNDMTGGCSGGPWILGWGHPWEEVPDTDGSDLTDPIPLGQGFLNGVNSHKINYGGLRTQEMGSAQFTNSHPNTEILWSDCQGRANSY